MVNNGRSRGCFTCRARKVKCDETVPTCTRCRTSRIQCGGYETKFIFIDGKTVRPIKASLMHRSSESRPNQKTAEPQGSDLEPVLKSDTAAGALIHDLNLGAFSDTICRSFLAKNMWTAHEVGHINFLDCTHTSRLLRNSSDALAYKYFGLYHHHPRIRAHAVEPYIIALGQLSKSLKGDDLIDSIHGILAIVLLIHYEIMSDASLEIIFLHVNGLARLVEARGPWRHQSPVELYVFEIVRELLAIFFMGMRKRCFLEKPPWLNVPWALRSDAKPIKEKLRDLCCFVGGFLADFDTTNQQRKDGVCSHEEYQSELRELRERTLYHFHASESLRRQWREAFPLAYQLTTCHDHMKSFPVHLFGTPLHFHNFTRAAEFTNFGQLQHELVCLISDIDRALRISTKNEASLPSQSPPTIDLVPLTHAKRLCRCIPYLLDFSKHGSSGAVTVQWYVHRILATFEPGSEESRWLTNLNSRCENEFGLREGQGHGQADLSGHKPRDQLFIQDNSLPHGPYEATKSVA